MSKTHSKGLNPILPPDEYIPDGEPHVFGDRIYLFGSHDTKNGMRYCSEENYVGWSAPLSDPTDWTCSGVIYEASQDPFSVPGEHNDLYAPDVVLGNDGRYYLYYNLVSSGASSGMNESIGVAVSDRPDGKYEYYGRVKNPDGSFWQTYLCGDPAVINDDGVIRLYCGWSLSMVAAAAHQGGGATSQSMEARKAAQAGMTGSAPQGGAGQTAANGGAAQAAANGGAGQAAHQLPKPGSPAMKYVLMPVYQMMFHKNKEDVEKLEYPLMGANCLTLADDMLTVRGPVSRIVPGQFDTPEDSSFYGHAFYEASSIRKIEGRYYFIYSSENSNELCYATSEEPDRNFVYGGTIISNGDVGFEGRKKEDRLNFTANDHGSLEKINGQWYIFHHRQTRKGTFSRQACAEPVEISADGKIAQVECTSMGLRSGLLKTEGTYPAICCCTLTNGQMPHCTNTRLDIPLPCVTDDGKDDMIGEITEGTLIGYKYFDFKGPVQITLTYRADADCKLKISTADEATGQTAYAAAQQGNDAVLIDCKATGKVSEGSWETVSATLDFAGKAPIFLRHMGGGQLELKSFRF